ncbi:MAG: hypothetical protein U0414_32130 [Polyangiaceae bacterium]
MNPFPRALLGALVLTLTACSGAPRTAGKAAAPSAPPSASVPVAASSAAVPALDPATVTVTTLAIPASVQLDGDPSEWGALDALPPVSGEPAQKPGVSHVGVALDGEAIHLVGTIGGAAKAGLTVALKFPSPELPQIGYHGRSDIYPIGDCTEPDPTDAERYQRPNPFQPPQEECKKLLAAYQKFTAEHLARFERVLRIDENGVTTEGSSAALDRVRFESKPTPAGFTFEADLPVELLPRCTTAPIADIALAAAPGLSAHLPEGAFVGADFDPPVHFEPLRAVREYAFAKAKERYYSEMVVSYQPGDWNKIEVVERDPSQYALEASERALYTKLGGDGDVEFGRISMLRHDVVALRAGEVVGGSWFHNAPAKPIRRRLGDVDGWLLVSAWNEPEWGEGYEIAGFDTCFIRASDGHLTELWGGGGPRGWSKVQPSVSADLEVLTLVGTVDARFTLPYGTPATKKYVWRLDKSKSVYVERP